MTANGIIAGIGGTACRVGRALGDTFLAERDRWPLWLPVGLAIGIAIFFAADREPDWLTAMAPAMLLVAVAVSLRLPQAETHWTPGTRQGLLVVAVFTAAIAVGFAAAKLRTAAVAAPVIAAETDFVDIVGTVRSAARQPDRSWRIVVAPTRIGDLPVSRLPDRIRLSARQKGVSYAPGQVIRVRGVLMPPPGPAAPGDFDFARQAWFQGIGGVGYTVSRPTVVAEAPASLALTVNTMRLQLAERVRAVLPGTVGAVAAALMTGDREAIPDDVNESLRIAGLAHVLAISGLHMALVGGFLFAAARLGLALIPPLALRKPIKKWAAVAGLIGSAAYLLLSGASISTQRAFIMISLMFIAILLDRPALSLRVVAVAAAIILLVTPESLLHAGFQMSFAAVIGLVAFYEWRRDRKLSEPWAPVERAPHWHVLHRTWIYVAGIAVTTIVAELAVGPFAIFHFNRVAAYGLIANLLAMPLVGVVIMPAAVATFLLLPFGLEASGLAAMGWGVDRLIAIAAMVSGWQGSEIHVPAWPVGALLLIVGGGLWLALWRRPWRLAGAAAIAAGGLVATTGSLPDIYIDREGSNVAIRAETGLDLMSARRAAFAAGIWFERAGLDPAARPEREDSAFICDASACVATLRDGRVMSVIRHVQVIEEECQRADIIVTHRYLPWRWRRACRAVALVIDRSDLKRGGAHAIHLTPDGPRVVTAQQHRGNRPWAQASE